MKKAFLFVGMLAASAMACRAVVGIDDLAFQPTPDGGDHHGQNDGSVPDSGDGGATADEKIAACHAASDCRGCCKQTFNRLHDSFEAVGSAGAQCMCQSSVCGTQCANAGVSCPPTVGPPAAGSGPDGCIRCFDTEYSLKDGGFPCTDKCAGDLSCLNGLRCLQQCQ